MYVGFDYHAVKHAVVSWSQLSRWQNNSVDHCQNLLDDPRKIGWMLVTTN